MMAGLIDTIRICVWLMALFLGNFVPPTMRKPSKTTSAVPGLVERLGNGENVLVSEGYLFEMERRGYLAAGSYIPECVLDHPEQVYALYREFARAGSDVIVAFTYYGNRERMRLIGREKELEQLNRKALGMARQAADETGKLMAGCLSNTTLYSHTNPDSQDQIREIFTEQVTWAVEEGADFIIGETFTDLELPHVITFTKTSSSELTRDGVRLCDACKCVEDMGATVTGLNCSTGPTVIMESMREIRRTCRGYLAALPVPYRTSHDKPTMQQLVLPSGKMAFPMDLDYFNVANQDVSTFGRACMDLGIQYIGLCCGNSSRFFRTLAETCGRCPEASRYSLDQRYQSFPLRERSGSDQKTTSHVGF